MFVTTKKSMHFLHSTRGCSGLHCTNQAATASSHRIRRTHRNLLLRYPPTDGTDAHRILVPPVWTIVGGYGILPYPRNPLRGFSGLRCTNRALVHQH